MMDRLAKGKGSASQECLDGGDGHQFDWLRGWSWGGHPAVDWKVTLFKHPDYKGKGTQR